MNPVSIDLQPGWLHEHETEAQPLRPKGRRSFQVRTGGECFVLSVDHVPVPGAESFTTPEEEPRRATDREILAMAAGMFLGSLPGRSKEPDLEAGWQAWREEIAATQAVPLPSWSELPGEVREAFSAALRAAFQGENRSAKRVPAGHRPEGDDATVEMPVTVDLCDDSPGSGVLGLEFSDGRLEEFPFRTEGEGESFRRIYPAGSAAILKRYGFGNVEEESAAPEKEKWQDFCLVPPEDLRLLAKQVLQNHAIHLEIGCNTDQSARALESIKARFPGLMAELEIDPERGRA